jgi:hypothetical protein
VSAPARAAGARAGRRGCLALVAVVGYGAAAGAQPASGAASRQSAAGAAASAPKPRARELGIPIGGTAGPLDAITDVAGVEVGHVTLVRGAGKLVRGTGPVRTGVTVIHPRGATTRSRCSARGSRSTATAR